MVGCLLRAFVLTVLYFKFTQHYVIPSFSVRTSMRIFDCLMFALYIIRIPSGSNEGNLLLHYSCHSCAGDSLGHMSVIDRDHIIVVGSRGSDILLFLCLDQLKQLVR